MLDVIHADSTADEAYNGKTLTERLTGRFYTPDALAEQLARSILAAIDRRHVSNALKVTDPFCGDGRLVEALLREAAKCDNLRRLAWHIELRDRDEAAAQMAAIRVTNAAATIGISAKVDVRVGDTFEGSLNPRFDVVITNPPWELLKPDVRELSHMSEVGAANYKHRLRAASDRLDRTFPEAVGVNAWGGWSTNLARCGWSLSMQICRPGGVIGIVLPATILADQSSERIRRFVFEDNSLAEAAVFPAEARLFERVDQPVAALTIVRAERPSGDARLLLYGNQRMLLSTIALDVSPGSLAARGWSLSVGFGATAGRVLSRLDGLSTLGELEKSPDSGLWLGRELDETRITEKTAPGIAMPFVKGRMVGRHRIVSQPTTSVLPAVGSRFVSSKFPRFVWRDVSRASQKRRMIGTVIPAGWVAGNSLHVGCFRDGDMSKTVALHAVLSSFVLELQVRSRLSTGHMSLGVVRQSRIPSFKAQSIKRLAAAGRRALGSSEEGWASDALEVAVAREYGLDRSSMIAILEHFPKIDDDERERIAQVKAWQTA